MLFYHPRSYKKNFKVFQYTLSELDFTVHTYVPLLANIDHTWDMLNLIKCIPLESSLKELSFETITKSIGVSMKEL